jgi:hypothetical protein
MPLGGWSRGLAEPAARSVQEISDRGRQVTFTWFDPPFRPQPPHSTQAYGICFTEAGMIVLGAGDFDGERYVNLLGGGVEPGETLEDCLVRPEDFLRTLSWGSAPSAAIILAAGLKAEAERGQG